jgi:hypothetical protein
MNYVVNPDNQPNYLEIKNIFNEIKNIELNDVIPEINILISNNRSSHSRGDFFEEQEKYIGKIISIFLIQKEGIEHIVGPVLINNVKMILYIMNYINGFIPCDNVYIEEQENLEKQVLNYYNELNDINININIKFTNVIYN